MVVVASVALITSFCLLPGISSVASFRHCSQNLRMMNSARLLTPGGPWVRLWHTVAQGVLPAVTAVRVDVTSLAVGTNGREREAMITIATCFESCQVYIQALGRDGDLPVKHEERGSPSHTRAKRECEHPAIPSVPRMHPHAWLDSARISVDKYRVVLLITFRGYLSLHQRVFAVPNETRQHTLRSSPRISTRAARCHRGAA